jgi:hypothetical protein
VAGKSYNTGRLKKAFLAAFADTGNITASAKLAGIARATHYDWMGSDEKYAKAFAAATEEAADLLELEARRRAVDGVDEPVIHQGQLMGTWVNDKGERVTETTPGAKHIPLTIKKYSDTMLIFLIKGARPQKYRERFEHTGAEGGPILLKPITLDGDKKL